jgi:P-type Ca2+ transporter type 2C
VRHLAAVETLGSADVIASDKTGTLTRNEMTLRKVVTASGSVRIEGRGYDPDGAVTDSAGGRINDSVRSELERALTVADRANNAVLQQRDGHWIVQGDPTEGALLVAARKAGLDPTRLEARFVRLGEIPFSSERKLMTTIHGESSGEERTLVLTKRAPDVLLARCSHEFVAPDHKPLSTARRAEILKETEDLAKEALRTLGVAYRALPKAARQDGAVQEGLESDLVFAGLVGMMDPPREEAKRAVARAQRAGIRAVMITGDHPITASVIASELGIRSTGPAVTGSELTQLSAEELGSIVQRTSVYARVTPEHKLRIVRALQQNGL